MLPAPYDRILIPPSVRKELKPGRNPNVDSRIASLVKDSCNNSGKELTRLETAGSGALFTAARYLFLALPGFCLEELGGI